MQIQTKVDMYHMLRDIKQALPALIGMKTEIALDVNQYTVQLLTLLGLKLLVQSTPHQLFMLMDNQ
ncbi:hypothetical protein DN757_02360 [Paenibacillus silvae]|uniref:Uncharacterized protein n=1 Tax=Paenibacillus silvae TaxID=1325358 RepID=A0A2W6PH60_9BACL|nr:hypothetical protein DN757_02360 [Paenibacillus silvae]